jgi:hypothetical protein
MLRTIRRSLPVLLTIIASSASAAEFQPIGALGIGGAGVARINNAYAAYWNPAGLAFNDQTMTIPLDVSVGLRVSKGLADNVDRLSKFTENDNTGTSPFDRLKNLKIDGSDPKAVTDMINLLSVIDDIKTQNGTLSLNQNAVIALQIKHFAIGAFMSSEGFAQPLPDLVNVLPSSTSNNTTTVTPQDIYNAAGLPQNPTTVPAYNPGFFTTEQLQGIANVFSDAAIPNRLDSTKAMILAQKIDSQMLSNPNPTGLSNTDIYNTVTITLRNQLLSSTGNTIDKNKTAVLVKALSYIEFPLAYGHPFDLGSFGKLGVGGSVKIVSGRVYQSRLLLVESGGNGTSSEDITKNFDKNYEETTSVTGDLGLFWKYNDWLNVGLVAKNLTTPKFKSPELKDQNGRLVDRSGNSVVVPYRDADVKLKPQMRMGIALEPWSWLTFAMDYDLTKNETVLSGLDYKNQTLGGGVEIHPGRWFKLRAGMYKNLADSEIGPVATAGLTFGLPWFNFEVDGAYGLETAKYKEDSFPKEAKVQAQLNIQF